MNVNRETVSMRTRDGVRLDADLYRPEAAGEYPVLLMRQPYGRAIASTVVYAHPAWYAAQGYLVVIQDVRGRGTSEGKFKLFESEIADGYDTVQWAAGLPGSTGRVGMYGFSYQGMTQLYAAIAQPPALATLCPAMIGYDLYTDWTYEGGAFCLQANLGWALQISAETARRRGDEAAFLALANAAKSLTWNDAIPTRSPLLESLDPDSFYGDWLRHDQPDAYWQRLSPKPQFDAVDLPILHIGGWYDTFMRGTLHLYQAMVARSTQRQQLVVGPWAHLPWGRKVGVTDFGPAAASPCDRWQLRWFDQVLKDIDTGLLQEPAIHLFEMGSDQWRRDRAWPATLPTPFYLSSTGLAALRDDDGILSRDLPLTPSSPPPDILVHDPWRPVPALGGHAAVPTGPCDRSSLDCRTDILTYTTAPFQAALQMAGVVSVQLYCTADVPSFDLCAVLSIVHSTGPVINLAQGYRRIESQATDLPLRVTLQPTCVQIQPGQALRLSLSAACFPAHPVNAGDGSPPAETRLINQQVITITLHSGATHPSQIVVPTRLNP
jgi:uncharacterized protein